MAVRQVVTQIPGKPSNDVLRNLRNDLERYKNENQDLREDKSALTQQFLYAKEQINELLHKMDQMKKKWGGQDRLIQDKVQQGIQANQERLQSAVQLQRELISKLRREKVLLSKNTFDLQERLRDTRHELHLTQKQLYSFQTAHAQATDKASNIDPSQSTAKPGRRSNQIMNFDGQYHNNQEINQNQDREDQENQQLDSFRVQMKGNKTKTKKVGLGVARSLALAKIPFNAPSDAEQKYNWLFNEDETPRDKDHVNKNQDSNAKMLRQNKYLDQNEDETTAPNSNFARRQQPQIDILTDGNLTDTMQSMHENQDEVLLGRKNGQHTRGSPQVSESLVGKSIQGMKNILRKAKEADFQAIMPRASIGGGNRPNSRTIDHNNVELEFANGNTSKYEDNPLDDDSN